MKDSRKGSGIFSRRHEDFLARKSSALSRRRAQERLLKKYHHLFINSPISALCRGQSRLTLVTGNEGCVRYPTEGNNSSHELTTAMQHLPNCLATTDVSARLQLGFKPW